MPLIWKWLQERGFLSFKPGFLNQDILENFSGCLRSHSHRFVHLTCQQFDGLFKTFLINNLTSPHLAGANCRDDASNVLEFLVPFLQNTNSQQTLPIELQEKEYFEENELKDTSTKAPGNQVLNLAWLRHSGDFLNKLAKKCHV